MQVTGSENDREGKEGFRIDMHVKVLDERVVRRAKARGLDALVYAPHFTALPEIERRAIAYSDDGLLVIPAREVFCGGWCERKHLLVLGLADPIPDYVSLSGAFAEIERQGALALVPHPEFLTVSLDIDDIETHRESVSGVEVYNAKFRSGDGGRAAEIARRVEAPPFASSYAHLRGTVGEAWTVFDRADVSPTSARSSDRSRVGWRERVRGVLDALEKGVPRSIGREEGLAHRVRSAAEFAHLGYENSLTKTIRVLDPRLPATHPGRPVYADRFDDVRVY